MFKVENQYEHVIQCSGMFFNADFLTNNQNFLDCVSYSGQIYVNDHMQVTNVNPLRDRLHPIAGSTKTFSNIFAVGDCCLTRINEEKTVLPAKLCAEVVAENIKKESIGNLKLKSHPKNFPCLYAISLGPTQGIFIFNNMVKVNKSAAHSKVEYQQAYMEYFRGTQKGKSSMKKMKMKMRCLLCCA